MLNITIIYIYMNHWITQTFWARNSFPSADRALHKAVFPKSEQEHLLFQASHRTQKYKSNKCLDNAMAINLWIPYTEGNFVISLVIGCFLRRKLLHGVRHTTPQSNFHTTTNIQEAKILRTIATLATLYLPNMNHSQGFNILNISIALQCMKTQKRLALIISISIQDDNVMRYRAV